MQVQPLYLWVMITHTSNLLTLYFGTQKEGFAPKAYHALTTQKELCAQAPFSSLRLNTFITLNQTHSTTGYIFTHENSSQYTPYSAEGDYLITSTPDIALGVATADCLPIVAYDPKKNIIGIAHAGWQGTAQGISLRMLEHMHTAFNVVYADLLIFLGPAARSCCYEVQPEFLKNFATTTAITHRNTKLYFDTSTHNYNILVNAGILATNIFRDYNICTICNPLFCSYRRDGAQSKRQMTTVILKK